VVVPNFTQCPPEWRDVVIWTGDECKQCMEGFKMHIQGDGKVTQTI
jgi:hypothetical protein